MEKQQEDFLMKVRSFRSIVRTGLRLYMGSFSKTFKATWLFTLMFMLVAAITGTLLTMQATPVILQMIALTDYKWIIAQEHWTLLASLAVMGVVGFLVLLLLYGAAGNKLVEHKETGTITMPSRWFSVGRPSVFKTLRRIIAAALRHKLLTLGVLFLGCLVTTPICIVACLPAIVLIFANISAQAGTLIGDPLGMPSYIVWLSAGTWMLAAFMQAYIYISLLFVGYYAYGSAETRKKEREQHQLNKIS